MVKTRRKKLMVSEKTPNLDKLSLEQRKYIRSKFKIAKKENSAFIHTCKKMLAEYMQEKRV